jgi:hypothetical protein
LAGCWRGSVCGQSCSRYSRKRAASPEGERDSFQHLALGQPSDDALELPTATAPVAVIRADDGDLDMNKDDRHDQRKRVQPQWIFAIFLVALLVFLACAHLLGET